MRNHSTLANSDNQVPGCVLFQRTPGTLKRIKDELVNELAASVRYDAFMGYEWMIAGLQDAGSVRIVVLGCCVEDQGFRDMRKRNHNPEMLRTPWVQIDESCADF